MGLQNLTTSAAGQKMTLTGKLDQWILTPLDHSKENPALTLDTVSASGISIHDVGTLYRGDGMGFLYGPVGEPAAYLSADFKIAADGTLNFTLESQMSGILVDPGETRAGQEAVLWFRPPREAWPGGRNGLRSRIMPAPARGLLTDGAVGII